MKYAVALLVVVSVTAGLLFIRFDSYQEDDRSTSFESDGEGAVTEPLQSRVGENGTQPGDSIELPDDYEPRIAEEPPKENRYVNEYFLRESPEWQPENNYTLEEGC